MRLIDAGALYERTCSLEAQALDYVGKLIERDGDKVSVEWKIWSAILAERTAFKHDVFDAPTIEAEPIKRGRWKRSKAYPDLVFCDECGEPFKSNPNEEWNYCPNCGAKMI